MGHSEYGPVAKERRPWNPGRMVGAKRAVKPQPVWAIRFWLDHERRLSGCQPRCRACFRPVVHHPNSYPGTNADAREATVVTLWAGLPRRTPSSPAGAPCRPACGTPENRRETSSR